MNLKQLQLYLVTDRTVAADRDMLEIVRKAVCGGVTMVQLREKDCDTRTFLEIALRMKEVLEGSGVPMIINDRVDIALACGADGVHIGQSDMPYEMARRLMGPDKIIGLSVENLREVEEANALDVDYIGVSPVFATPTKTDTALPFGLEGLQEARRISTHPIVAIGGINLGNASRVIASGADGIAVVSAIIGAPDPYVAAQDLMKAVRSSL